MNIKLHNEDCLDTLSRMEDDSVDVVITSPPYNMNPMNYIQKCYTKEEKQWEKEEI